MAINYQDEVNREARHFLVEQSEMLATAIAEERSFDRNQIDGLDRAFYENVTDRSYTFEDACFVLVESDNRETDSGLWEGQDPEEAVKTMATYTFSNDVWTEGEKLYDSVKEEVDSHVEELQIEEDSDATVIAGTRKTGRLAYSNPDSGHEIYVLVDRGGDYVGVGAYKVDGDVRTEISGEDIDAAPSLSGFVKCIEDAEGEGFYTELLAKVREAKAEELLNALLKRPAIEQVEPGSATERDLLATWLRLNGEVGQRGGYPFGQSYIDARCGVGYGQPDQLEYVNLDNDLGKALPHLFGKDSSEVRDYYRETFLGPDPETAEDMLRLVSEMISDRASIRDLAALRPRIEEILGAAKPSM
jgi:hypothetical protein